MTALVSPPLPLAVPAPAAPAAKPQMTIEEFIERYQGTNAEYVDGVVKEPTMVWPKRGKTCRALARALGTFIEDNDRGHFMTNDSWFRTGPKKMRGGDVCYCSYARLPKGEVPEGELDVVPDLVGEVRSPTDRWIDVFAKVGEYLKAGVLVVAVVDPEKRTASAYRLPVEQAIFEEADTLVIPDVLPGFSVAVARLFA
ncbi:MAG: Uma2 family endonuclease [Gemmataceae bacterium]|nr:Uma2 family endonuclease [Gemmataceae bacterium]